MKVEERLRTDLVTVEERLRADIKQLADRVGRLEYGQAKLEGLLEGLREAITGRGRQLIRVFVRFREPMPPAARNADERCLGDPPSPVVCGRAAERMNSELLEGA